MVVDFGTRLLCVSLLAGGALCAAIPAAADVKDGVDAWSRGDFSTAIREWKNPAAKGDPDAQFNMGQAYKMGRGVERDLAKAEKYFSEAAARGHLQAADNYGLLLFQRGERTKAMPFVHAASDRGDARAQYILGLAYFNGDTVPKDWERAYALVSLAQQAGLPQAAGALSQMDMYIPLDQRQKSVALASRLAAEAEAKRRSQIAAADLGADVPVPAPAGSSNTLKPFRQPQAKTSAAGQMPGSSSPASAGADFTRSGVPPVSSILTEGDSGAPPQSSKPAARPKPSTASVPVKAASPAADTERSVGGLWRVQLGAFGVSGNAESLWNRVKDRAELAGHAKIMVPSGRVTKLQAGGFASADEARSACNTLKSAGIDCLAVRN